MSDTDPYDFAGLEQQYKLPEGLLSAVAQTESNGNPNAVSPTGARGLFQFMPNTAKQYGVDPTDPQSSAEGAAKYYSDLLKQSGGHLDSALAAYNFGPGNVAAGKPLPAETQDYVSKVKSLMPQGEETQAATKPSLDEIFSNKPSLDEIFGPSSNGASPPVDNSNNVSSQPSIPEDVAKSVLYRGIPEGLAASTLGGFGLNTIRGVSDLTRWAAGKAYKALEGEDLPNYTDNPVPSSSDVLKAFSKGLTGKDLYEPQTTPGQFANTISSFAAGGKTAGVPLRASIPAAVASESAGQATEGTGYEPAARIVGAVLGGRKFASSKSETLTADQHRSYASGLFNKATSEGGLVPSEFTNKWIGEVNKNIPQTEEAKTVLGENSTTSLVNRINNLKDKPLSLTAAHEIDSGLGDLAEEQRLPDGKLSAQGQKIYDIRNKLQQQIEDLPDQGFQTLSDAKAAWFKSIRLGDVERGVKKAIGTTTPDSSLKTFFNNLVNSPKFSKYTPEEQSALKKASKTGFISGSGKFLSGGLLPGIMAMVEDAATGGYTGAVTAYTIGKGINMAGKAISKNSQLNRANNALNTISNSGVERQPSPLMQLFNSNIPEPRRIGLQKVGQP